MGSREQMCTNKEVKNASSYAQRNMCKSLGMNCPFYRNACNHAKTDIFNDESIPNKGLMDIEDLVSYGTRHYVFTAFFNPILGVSLLFVPRFPDHDRVAAGSHAIQLRYGRIYPWDASLRPGPLRGDHRRGAQHRTDANWCVTRRTPFVWTACRSTSTPSSSTTSRRRSASC